MHPLFGEQAEFRIAHIDILELNASHESKQKVASLAKNHIHKLLSNAKTIRLNFLKTDKGEFKKDNDNRIYADVYFDGKNLGDLVTILIKTSVLP